MRACSWPQDPLAFTQGPQRRSRGGCGYIIPQMAGRITRGSRQVTLHLQHSWRWAAGLAAAFARLRALPLLS